MNIIIDNQRTAKPATGVERETTSHGASAAVQHRTANGGYALDISGTVMDNTAYDGQGKTAEDIMQEAGLKDTALTKNYLAIMSNSMSDEDFARLQEEGFHPGSTEIETVVTILDQIKASLVRGGAEIAGYTDDLDREVLKEITGSETMADELIARFHEKDTPLTKENAEEAVKALEKSQDAKMLNEGSIKYMLKNSMEPTVDNVYKAMHSTTPDTGKQPKGYYKDETAGYYAKKAEDYQWEKLKPQMEKIIQESGQEVSSETLSDAKWLIEKGIPLTSDSLTKLRELRELKLPSDSGQMAAAIASALSMGRPASAASYTDSRSFAEKAADFIQDITGITEEAVDLIAKEGGKLNLKSLKTAQIRLGMSQPLIDAGRNETGRLLLEEIRLKMTVEAGIRLQKKGFRLDTAELKDIVEGLEAAVESEKIALFGGEGAGEKVSLYRETLEKVQELPLLPAAVIGRYARKDIWPGMIQVEDLHREGKLLQSVYQKAGETYETLMTAPRSDMGDSLKKAFRSADQLLQNMDMELTDENRRAVRILAYNRMEVSEEQILAVKEADYAVKQAIQKMTPGTVHRMIKEGINPLQMNLEELENYLNQNEDTPEKTVEKYSEYLYGLEGNDAISKEEKDAYIGIFRLFRQLEKTDGAAIGALVNAGAEISLKNLLSSIRSSKKQGMDVKVNDEFGGIESIFRTESITEQINSGFNNSERGNRAKEGYYKKLSREIYQKLDISKLDEASITPDMDLEELARILREDGNGEGKDQAYLKDQAQQLRAAVNADDEVIRMLLDFDQPLTSDHILSAGQMLRARGRLAKQMDKLSEETDKHQELEDAVQNLQENLSEEVKAKESYEQLTQTCSDIVEEVLYSRNDLDRIDLKELSTLHKQIQLAGKLSKEGNYEIPVTINGEITSVNLKIIHGSGQTGKVAVTMETEAFGKAAACLTVTGEEGSKGKISGYVVCEGKENAANLQEKSKILKDELENWFADVGDVKFIHSDNLDINNFPAVYSRDLSSEKSGNPVHVESAKLYHAAKALIGFIQA